MKKIGLFIGLMFTLTSTTYAQKVWSLEECINYALENNIQIKQSKLQIDDKDIRLNTSKNSRLPSVSGSLGGNMFFGRGPSRDGTYTDNTQTNASIGLNVSVPVYEGSRIKNEILTAELNLKATVEDYAKAKEDLSLNITSFYLQVLFNKEIVKVAEKQCELSRSVVERSKILFENGRESEDKYYESLSLLAKDELALTEAKVQHSLNLLDLAQALNFESAEGFEVNTPVIDSLGGEYLADIISAKEVYEKAVKERPQVLAEELRLKSFEQQLKVVKSAFYPRISFGAGYNNSYYYSFAGGVNNTQFIQQMRRNGNETIGLTISVPIFNKLATRNQVRLANLSIKNQTLELEDAKIKLNKEIEKSYFNADASRQKYTSASEALKAAAIAFKYEEQKSLAGSSTIFDYNDSKTRYIRAESERIRAKYEFIFNKKILDFYYGIPLTQN